MMNREKIFNIYKHINSFLKENVVVIIFILLFFLKFENAVVLPSFFRKEQTNTFVDSMALQEYSTVQARDGVSSMAKSVSYAGTIALASPNNGSKKKIIKNVGLSIKVEDISKTKNILEKDVEDFAGFMDNFYSYDYYNEQAFNFSINIPTGSLDKFLLKIKAYGEVRSENFSLQDKTEIYVDNENKLKNLYARRNSLRKMMETKTASLADILAVDRELNSVQYEIERFEKINKDIDNKVEYSSVNLTILPNFVVENKVEKWKLKKSLGNAINILIKAMQKLLDYLLVVLVFSPILLFIFLVYKISLKRKK